MMSTFDKNDLAGFVGKHLIYTYDNGWNYELYIKNASTVDYRIHSGMVGNRWVKDQRAYIVRVAQEVYKVSWTEPTGTDVSLIANLGDRLFHGTIFFPRWVMNNPQQTVCFQNEHLNEMNRYREAGPAYPTEVIDEFATITLVRDCGADNDEVIACAASELPADFPANLLR
ncbi:phenolic acid decarboxylase [Pantoea sp. EABMAA-21]|uniref:phenolic acid decarboxylase n=1 Tax=unclassified Pantoea TaxID=2630326 RepID=UPI0015968A53|nr:MULTISPECIES: phenolic acid decarboxylase [unclassified Pantoea]MDF7630563.1 phenolic acid decarboxylase [Erwiniaceae bacterium L1_55_4]MDI9276046.1 phenolic acid decarboxylase [Pantoea sp. EABMAA-21]